ncbi:hypothetical protein [Maribacter sp. IgM3_T14_3]|uniref:hypothetical protein n=1 Tax=Maribacter sp. IgM3_T14_3 TaxID=3415140 RepID=UPI003C6FF2F0
MESTFQWHLIFNLRSAESVRTYPLLFFVLLCGVIHGQRISIEVGEFSSVLVDREVPIYFLEDPVPMVVFDGFPLDGVHAEIMEGILVIDVPDEVAHYNGTVVVRYKVDTEDPSKYRAPAIVSVNRCGIIEPPNATKF